MKYGCILILMCSLFKAQAQRYMGGTGSGYQMVFTESFIAGGNPNAKYAGAQGNGFSSNTRETFMAGGNPNARYAGGAGTGYALQSTDIMFLNGTNPNARYRGGNGNGYQLATTETFIPGGNPYARFGGGTGAGFHSMEGQLVLALPVVLIQFDAQRIGQTVALTWTTAQETGNRMFEVERSSDKMDATIIAAVKGSGQSSVTRQYQVNDEHPLSGITYYRLKQTDDDGAVDYSRWVAVRSIALNKETVVVSPNPSDGNFKVTFPAHVEEAVLYDLNGKAIQQIACNGMDQLSFSNIATGLYVLTFTCKDGSVQSTKISIY